MALFSLRFQGEDKVSQTIDRIKGKLAGLADAPGPTPIFDVANLPGALRSVASFQGALGAIGTMGVPGALAAVGVQLGQVTAEMLKTGSEALRLRDSFEDAASASGMYGQELLRGLQQASAGTITNTDLMLAANRAMMLGVADSADEMVGLLEVAMDRAQYLGLPVQKAFDDLITGIGRMSPQILDNLAITGIQDAIAAYAESIGKTGDQLTDAQKRQALVNAVLASGKGNVDANTLAFAHLGASMENLKTSISTLLTEGTPLLAWLNNLASAIDNVSNSIMEDRLVDAERDIFALGDSLTGMMESYRQSLDKISAAQISGDAWNLKHFSQLADMQEQALRGIGEEYNKAAAITNAPLIDVEALRRGEIAFLDTAAAIGQVEDEAAAAGPTMAEVIAKMGALGQVAAFAAGDVKSLESAFAGLQGRMAFLGGVTSLRTSAIGQVESLARQAVQAGGDPAQITAMVGEATDKLWNMGLAYDATAEAGFENQLAVDAAAQSYLDYFNSVIDADKATRSFASGGLSEAQKAFDDLRGRVSGVLSQSLTLDPIGVNPDDFLPRVDAVQEDAFRLADVMINGFNSPWAAYFKDTFPQLFSEMTAGGDIQAGAAGILREFQAGLRPELMDKDTVKENVRKMILGEQSMAALADEIAQEIAGEMNISLTRAQAAVGSVLGPMGAVSGSAAESATGFAQAFSEGADPGTAVAKVTAGLVAAFNAQEANVRSSGVIVGGWWGEGFLGTIKDNVPVALLDVLVANLLPAILAASANQSSQTNPVDAMP